MKIFSLTIITTVALLSCNNQKEVKPRPNILLFIGDDMNWNDCSPYGNNEVYTPNMQRLANEGMCFDNMHTSTAMCAPTRQQLFSGLYPVRSGAYPNHSEMYEGTKSFATYFNELGYRTGLIGKVHQGPESSFPYEYFGGRHHDNGQGQDLNLNKVESFITGTNEKPYFLVIAQNQPHSPWNRGNELRYNADSLTVPEYYVDTKNTRSLMTKYYAEITYADSLLGVCLDYIDRSGQIDNTIVIFTSEQGSSFPFGKWTCYDLGLKTGFIVRWPNKVKAGSRNNVLAQYIDMLPTLLDIVGVNPDTVNTGNTGINGNSGFEGKSFKDVLLNEKQHHRDYVYGIHTTRGIYYGPEAFAIRSVRDKEYKFIWNINHDTIFNNLVTNSPKGLFAEWKRVTQNTPMHDYVMKYVKKPEFELYNILDDPYEINNLAVDPSYSGLIEKYKLELKKWMTQQGDKGHETEMEAKTRQVSH